MNKKLNYGRTFLIGMAFMSISSFWQVYDNIIPLIMKSTFGLGETITGVIMALDNVLALVLLPIFGSISDKVDTKLGKRTPFIIVGTALAVTFMMMLPFADKVQSLPWFVAALFGALVSMGLYRSPAVALMPDLTPSKLRSKANAVINLLGAVGGVYSLMMIKLLVGKGENPSYIPLFISIAIFMVVSIIVLVATIREKKLAVQIAVEETQEKIESEMQKVQEKEEVTNAKTVLTPEVKRSMIFMLASIFLWFAAYNAVTTAFSRYTTVVWKLEGGGFADCLMVATVAAILSYIPIGFIASRFGRKKTIMAGVLLMAFSFLIAMFMKEYHPLINIVFAMVGFGWAAIGVNSYPMIVDMSKGADIGKFTGTYYTFSMAAQIITPILSGFLLENVSYTTLFPYAAFFSLLAFVTMTQVKHGDVKPLKKESLLENFDVED